MGREEIKRVTRGDKPENQNRNKKDTLLRMRGQKWVRRDDQKGVQRKDRRGYKINERNELK